MKVCIIQIVCGNSFCLYQIFSFFSVKRFFFQFRYDYTAEIWNLGPSGWLEGNTDQLVIACDFIVDLYDFMIYMQDFRVVSLGAIDITLRGNILVDWLGNIIVSTVTTLFKGSITEFVSQRFKEFAQQTIDEMNSQRFAASHSHIEIEQMLQKVLLLKASNKIPFV